MKDLRGCPPPLGAVAVVADNLPLGAGRALLVLASTGLSWGAAAVVLGVWTHRARAAPVSGALALLAAVTSYDVVIELAGTRPGAGTSDLVREGAIWAAAAVVSGPVAGVSGWCARNGGRRTRSLAWGGLGGLLASQGV